jgi:hypothetical protein
VEEDLYPWRSPGLAAAFPGRSRTGASFLNKNQDQIFGPQNISGAVMPFAAFGGAVDRALTGPQYCCGNDAIGSNLIEHPDRAGTLAIRKTVSLPATGNGAIQEIP